MIKQVFLLLWTSRIDHRRRSLWNGIKKTLLTYLCEKLSDPTYVDRHKSVASAFTRVRKLTFATVFLLIIKKSVKSLQLVLNEWVLDTKKDFSVTAGALTRARKKLKHTAYVELNEDLVRLYYQAEDDVKRFRGYRLLAFDGSKIALPQTKAISDEFGSKAFGNQTGRSLGRYSEATYEACYDVLNEIAVESVLGKGNAYEVRLAEKMLGAFTSEDILIFDRGYLAYAFMMKLLASNRPFIIRCPKHSSNIVKAMFSGEGSDSQVVDIPLPHQHQKIAQEEGWPNAIRVRLVRVKLPSGELEVLATSLQDNTFGVEDFKELYRLRWGVETFFSKIKGRLSLENFTGKTVESVKQDFWATILVSNLETVMTEDVEEELNTSRSNKSKPLKINKSVSFHAIKIMALEIFFTEPDKEKLFEKLEKLFLLNPVTVRKDRRWPRKTISETKSVNYQKRGRKHVF